MNRAHSDDPRQSEEHTTIVVAGRVWRRLDVEHPHTDRLEISWDALHFHGPTGVVEISRDRVRALCLRRRPISLRRRSASLDVLYLDERRATERISFTASEPRQLVRALSATGWKRIVAIRR